MILDTGTHEENFLVEARRFKVVHNGEASPLNEFAARYTAGRSADYSEAPEITLTQSRDGLMIDWYPQSGQAFRLHSELSDQLHHLKSFPAAKQGAFNQALGRKTKTVLDATGGWGHDALLMAMQGYKVTIVERNPLMALILNDALERAQSANRFSDHGLRIPELIERDAHDLSSVELSRFDCVYLDPMFPPKRKRSAKPVKRIQFLQWLLGEESDAGRLANYVREAGAGRIVVKRPDYATPLIEKPHQQFSSKLVHYDVYLAA